MGVDRREKWEVMVRILNEGGCQVLADHGYHVTLPGLTIEPAKGLNFNRIFRLANGGTGYHFDLLVCNESVRPIDVTGFQIHTPWGIPRFEIVRTPKKSESTWPYDRALRDRFTEEVNLCRFFCRRKSRLNSGEELEGELLGWSEESIPECSLRSQGAWVTLRIFDSRGKVYSGRFGMRFEGYQMTAAQKRGATVRTPRRGLLSCPDRIIANVHSLIPPPAPEPISDERKTAEFAKLFESLARIR